MPHSLVTTFNSALDELSTRPIEIAVDTEFFGPHTLTIQTATRIDTSIIVQLYRSLLIPPRPPDFHVLEYLPRQHYDQFFTSVKVQRVPVIGGDLSPARLLMDLFGIPQLTTYDIATGQKLLEPSAINPLNGKWDARKERWRVPTIQLVLVGHFLPADFARLFGQCFYQQLLGSRFGDAGPVAIRDSKLLGFARPGPWFGQPPIVEYVALPDGSMFGVSLDMRDTCLPFGPASFDSLSKTFLGIGKSNVLVEADKKDMRQTFRTKTREAYGYAIVDAINTLLVHEQMQRTHRKIFHRFDFSEDQTPLMKATVGSRVAQFLTKLALHEAVGSNLLINDRAMNSLMSNGSRRQVSAGRFGAQMGTVHAGLLLSRSPTRFFHIAPGMLRDVDMSGCYNRVLTDLNIYCGRPIVFEPGSQRLSLRKAVRFAEYHAPSDGWMIRVTGDIRSMPNALVPSTQDAITPQNYKKARKKAASASSKADLAAAGACLYSQRIESGIVTWATWLLIQALPKAARREYEVLDVEAVILYPKKLSAESGPQYDRLVEKFKSGDLPWKTVPDFARMQIVEVEKIEEAFVSFRFRIGRVAEKIAEFRAKAQAEDGKGSGADLAWKLQANTMYGVLASPHFPIGNVVAANQVTATVRSQAFAMAMSLNAIQTITDGCSYRRDQIPACTFQECLRHQTDYPLRGADENSGIPFLDPANIPQDDVTFTIWYHRHVKKFFGLDKVAAGQLAMHSLVHKACGKDGRTAFDALLTDGAGNYVKCLQSETGGLQITDTATRGYGPSSKAKLGDWMLRTYSADQLENLPPITLDKTLLKFKAARQRAKSALASGIPAVYFPLGLEDWKVLAYTVLKPSAFIFQTPKQRKTMQKQIDKFKAKTGCGLELLALRRSYSGRQAGSLIGLAEEIYELIQSGGSDLTKKLNLHRLSDGVRKHAADRLARVAEEREKARDRLFSLIDIRNCDPRTIVTGFLVQAEQQ